MPGKIEPAETEDIAQHTDILASVLGFLNFDKPFISFGNDLFDPEGHRFSVNYLDGTYQLIKDGWSLHFDGNSTTGLHSLNQEMQGNMLENNRETAMELELFLKAVVQEYNYRMLHNQLTVKEYYE